MEICSGHDQTEDTYKRVRLLFGTVINFQLRCDEVLVHLTDTVYQLIISRNDLAHIVMLHTSRWFATKRAAYRKQLASALKLYQKNSWVITTREIVQTRARSRVKDISTPLSCSGMGTFQIVLLDMH